MKLILAFTFQYIIFLNIAFLHPPANYLGLKKKVSEIKMKKRQQVSVSTSNTREILRGELLFKF